MDVLLKAGGDPNIARDVSGIVELNGSFVYQVCPWLNVFENDYHILCSDVGGRCCYVSVGLC